MWFYFFVRNEGVRYVYSVVRNGTFSADVAAFLGALLAITRNFLDNSEENYKCLTTAVRYLIPLALAITAVVDLFFSSQYNIPKA